MKSRMLLNLSKRILLNKEGLSSSSRISTMEGFDLKILVDLVTCQKLLEPVKDWSLRLQLRQ